MFDKLFQFIRQGVRDAILGGFADAHEELANLAETGNQLVLEDKTADKPATRRKATAKG